MAADLQVLSIQFAPRNYFFDGSSVKPGAGWGGCTVSLVPEDKVDQFIHKIKHTYPPYKHLEGDALKEAIFATKPGNGACGEFILPFCST